MFAFAVCVRAKETTGVEGRERRAAPILMCESLGTITAITGPVASQHILSAYAATSPFPTPYSIHASRKSCEGSSPYVQRICGQPARYGSYARLKFDNFLVNLGYYPMFNRKPRL
ncbi:unnamed protein product [Lasius platythorax]|uniref:Secreted protein n=1 Tax=Lasius platythorax TaxID=488582 RepID=A0AAV2P173_9HYME